jgi:hypothetical protein
VGKGERFFPGAGEGDDGIMKCPLTGHLGAGGLIPGT